MNKKLLISVTIAFILCISVVFGVIAGTTRDRGTLELTPPPGSVNWTAWMRVTDYDDYGNPYIIHPPEIIMTEDSYLYPHGIGLGYIDEGWQIQVENFKVESIFVNMVFCGLKDYEGRNWEYSFRWDKSDSTTTHVPEVYLRDDTDFQAPRLLTINAVDETKEISFSGQPETKYQVYRSMSPATEDYDRSNGRYRHIGEAETNEFGFGQFIDTSEFAALDYGWYTIVYFAETWNGLHGCHSIFPDPTGTRVTDFKTEFDLTEKVIRLSWEKVAKDVLGFNLYRSTSKDIEGDKIYSVWIGDPDADNEGLFSYVDDDALEFGETYYYKLEILGLDMSRENIRPMSISQRAGYFFFMPLIQEGD